MFGIPSLAKLAVLGILLFVGWNMFKWLKSLSDRGGDNNKTVETEQCDRCGSYIAVGEPCPQCDKKDG